MGIGLIATAVIFTLGMWFWGGRNRPDRLDSARLELENGNTIRAEHILQTALRIERKRNGDASDRVRQIMELLGQTLARAGEVERAVELLRGMTGQEVLLAEMLLRQGLELYHGRREDRGRALLEEVVGLVSEGTAQAKMAAEHLSALDKKGRQCRCDSRGRQLSDQATRSVQAATAPGLVEAVEVKIVGTHLEMQVGFGRDPADAAEAAAVRSALRAALDEIAPAAS